MRNLEYIEKTYRHRKAMLYLLDYYFKEEDFYLDLKERILAHDMDKILMLLNLDKKTASKIHRKKIQHHNQNANELSELDFYEILLDFESGRYTKKDKPENAYDYVLSGKHNQSFIDNMMILIEKHNLDKKTIHTCKVESIVEKLNNLEVSEELIKNEIKRYIDSL